MWRSKESCAGRGSLAESRFLSKFDSNSNESRNRRRSQKKTWEFR